MCINNTIAERVRSDFSTNTVRALTLYVCAIFFNLAGTIRRHFGYVSLVTLRIQITQRISVCSYFAEFHNCMQFVKVTGSPTIKKCFFVFSTNSENERYCKIRRKRWWKWDNCAGHRKLQFWSGQLLERIDIGKANAGVFAKFRKSAKCQRDGNKKRRATCGASEQRQNLHW